MEWRRVVNVGGKVGKVIEKGGLMKRRKGNKKGRTKQKSEGRKEGEGGRRRETYRAALVSPNSPYLDTILCVESSSVPPGWPTYGNWLGAYMYIEGRE